MKSPIAALVLLLAFAAANAPAQDPASKAGTDADADAKDKVLVGPMSKFILDAFRDHEGKTLCSVGNVPVSAVRDQVVAYLKATGAGESVTRDAVEKSLWTLFPCPFSPLRTELLTATAKDVEGVWLFPYDSQPYRFGPNSPLQPRTPDQALACEIVGYFPGGELRTAAVLGAKSACPFRKAADLAPARKRPRVASWSMGADGRLKVTRSDIKDHIEEWDVYTVTRSFQSLNMEIKAGDLVAFLRRDKDNDDNAATEFRHLQRLK